MTYRNEFMPDSDRNLPVAPFGFENDDRYTSYKKSCEALLKQFYQAHTALPLEESVALGVLRANIQKRYEHQVLPQLSSLDEQHQYPDVMQTIIGSIHSRVMPGESIRKPLDAFMQTRVPAVEVGFRLAVGEHTSDPYDYRLAVLVATELQDMYGMEGGVHIRPQRLLKVTRITDDRKYAVIKTKVHGIRATDSDGTIESIGRRTGVVPLECLDADVARAALILARTSPADAPDIHTEARAMLSIALQEPSSGYQPVVERYYLAAMHEPLADA